MPIHRQCSLSKLKNIAKITQINKKASNIKNVPLIIFTKKKIEKTNDTINKTKAHRIFSSLPKFKNKTKILKFLSLDNKIHENFTNENMPLIKKNKS